jgi:hypothetical protein
MNINENHVRRGYNMEVKISDKILKAKCENCKWFLKLYDFDQGICKYHFNHEADDKNNRLDKIILNDIVKGSSESCISHNYDDTSIKVEISPKDLNNLIIIGKKNPETIYFNVKQVNGEIISIDFKDYKNKWMEECDICNSCDDE